jgi:hypothetical protein
MKTIIKIEIIIRWIIIMRRQNNNS